MKHVCDLLFLDFAVKCSDRAKQQEKDLRETERERKREGENKVYDISSCPLKFKPMQLKIYGRNS